MTPLIPSSFAGSATDPDATSRAVGPCTRPVLVTAPTLDLDTGVAGRTTLEVRCQSRLTKECPSCAALYAGDARAVLRDGLLDADGQPIPTTLVTLTASGRKVFGDVHQLMTTRRGKRSRTCRCGRTHLKGDLRLGTPLDSESYRYDAAAQFNAAASRLATVTFQKLSRVLGRPVQVARVVEYQQRGLVHIHALVRGVVNPADLQLAVRGGVNPRTGRRIAPARHRGWTWGPRCDARVLATDGNTVGRVSGYVTKLVAYLSKAVGEGLTLAAAFGARMQAAAVRAVQCAHGRSDCRHGQRVLVTQDGTVHLDDGDTDRLCRRHAAALRGWGWLGQALTVSRGWGASLGSMRARRRAAAQAHARADTDSTPGGSQGSAVAGPGEQLSLFPQVVTVGPWRVVGQRGRRPRLDLVQELVTPPAGAVPATPSARPRGDAGSRRQRPSAPACTGAATAHCPQVQLSFDTL